MAFTENLKFQELLFDNWVWKVKFLEWLNQVGRKEIMSLSDPIGDMLARIKNAQLRNHNKVLIPSSNFKAKIAEVLKLEGYIIDYEVKSDQNKTNLHISLKYNSGNPVSYTHLTLPTIYSV